MFVFGKKGRLTALFYKNYFHKFRLSPANILNASRSTIITEHSYKQYLKYENSKDQYSRKANC
jgi:hypothetical protein